jgi:alkanesulfonate monooxygenase SsuD/methylene tetrahydromethanopterin reductase-like flavin-dependent oxidoreductase (luciferase family)
MDPEPRPVQQPIPILIGGHSDPAIDRAARLGDGWIAARMSPERLAEHLLLLRAAAQRHDRDPGSLVVHCGLSGGDTSLEQLHRYEELGVHTLHVGIESLDELKRFADEVLPKVN